MCFRCSRLYEEKIISNIFLLRGTSTNRVNMTTTTKTLKAVNNILNIPCSKSVRKTKNLYPDRKHIYIIYYYVETKYNSRRDSYYNDINLIIFILAILRMEGPHIPTNQ